MIHSELHYLITGIFDFSDDTKMKIIMIIYTHKLGLSPSCNLKIDFNTVWSILCTFHTWNMLLKPCSE